MKPDISPTLRRILVDTRTEIARDKARQDATELKARLRDAIPVSSFASAVSAGNGVIAELKEKSPSQGQMRPQNVADAPEVYKRSPIVKAISVLTSSTNFGAGMTMERLAATKQQISKPVLRKDFIIEEYQIYQARAYGADAILLMANILDPDELQRLSATAFELGMDVLFETHCTAELDGLPSNAKIIGINSRSFEGGLSLSNFKISRLLRKLPGAGRDHSVDLERFGYVGKVPAQKIKVAESGISAANCRKVFSLGFHSVLVGTSLLMDPRGVAAALLDFESALLGSQNPVGEDPIVIR